MQIEIVWLKSDIEKLGIKDFADKFYKSFVEFQNQDDDEGQFKVAENFAFSLHGIRKFSKKYAGIYRKMLDGFNSLLIVKNNPLPNKEEIPELLKAYLVAYENGELWS